MSPARNAVGVSGYSKPVWKVDRVAKELAWKASKASAPWVRVPCLPP